MYSLVVAINAIYGKQLNIQGLFQPFDKLRIYGTNAIIWVQLSWYTWLYDSKYIRKNIMQEMSSEAKRM